jgi:hypothetical protein
MIMIMRLQADRLLQRLERERDRVERRRVALGKRDPIKDITGATAMDRAVGEARAIVQQLDSMLTSMDETPMSLELLNGRNVLNAGNGRRTRIGDAVPVNAAP